MDQPPRRAIYPKGNTLAVLRRLFMEGLFHCTFAEFISSVCKLHLYCQISSLNSMFCNDASYFSFKSEKSREVLHLVVQQIVLRLAKVKSFSCLRFWWVLNLFLQRSPSSFKLITPFLSRVWPLNMSIKMLSFARLYGKSSWFAYGSCSRVTDWLLLELNCIGHP